MFFAEFCIVELSLSTWFHLIITEQKLGKRADPCHSLLATRSCLSLPFPLLTVPSGCVCGTGIHTPGKELSPILCGVSVGSGPCCLLASPPAAGGQIGWSEYE